MGFFSLECKECGHPLLSCYATNDINMWMQNGVAITKNGDTIKGQYDGYGRLDGQDMAYVQLPMKGNESHPEFTGKASCLINDEPYFCFELKPTVYHLSCWEKAGQPKEYSGESANAQDQGYFFDDGDHDMPDPHICM